MIVAQSIGKTYQVHRRGESLRSTLASLWHRQYEPVVALENVDFRIEAGERVGILGPNGAGKTTLMKILSGLLHPSRGKLTVDGYEPQRRESEFLRRVSLVMGNKGQLVWDLPPIDTFEMTRVLFQVPRAEYRRSLAELADLLTLGTIMTKPTRQLSLGERMRCEIAAALIYQPRLLFLDEPTIGLDVAMQAALREFIADYNRRREATVLLTSHYVQDVVAICPRVIVVDHGSILYDGELRGFIAMKRPEKIVSFSADENVMTDNIARFGQASRQDGGRIELRMPRAEVPEVIKALVEQGLAADLTIEDPPLDEVLRQVFGDAKGARQAPHETVE